MSLIPIHLPMLPESAPFTPAQRAWLNGFFAGLINRRAVEPTGVSAPAHAPRQRVEVEEEFAWHDAAIPMDERLKLAEGKPLERVMMAAMAQLDCGACGYLCKTYGEAIARGEEKDLTRCAPGGRDTARKLKELLAKPRTASSHVVTPSKVPATQAEKPGYERARPVQARLLECRALNKPGSAKDTRMVALDLKESGIAYHPGDSLGVWPENCPDSVTWILEALDASGAEKVRTPDGSAVTLHEALLKHCVITKPSDALLELFAGCATDAVHADSIKQMLAEDGPGIQEGYEVLDLLAEFPSARPPLDKFVEALATLQPRLYSISSSLAAHPDQVHLTVGVVRYLNCRGRQCKGVASTYLGERIRPGQKARIFVQKSHGFRMPESPSTPMIMIGPGTGIAPFRAFLQERRAKGSISRNWLFFGDQKSEFDLLYRDELKDYMINGPLTRLTTAFSRDQEEKIYVQHRMLENAGEIWSWLSDGAHIYVCGDAKHMAADVDRALMKIVAEHGKLDPDSAKSYVSELVKKGRYQRDVY